mmetsp:Transcript_24496/g.38772  ORF Transcript_24496/g.38772 Transcript_24496/m.38772 type:complete len:135 (-) Transcript_24496:1288-1692(-)
MGKCGSCTWLLHVLNPGQWATLDPCKVLLNCQVLTGSCFLTVQMYPLLLVLLLLAHQAKLTPLGLRQGRPIVSLKAVQSTPGAHLEIHKMTKEAPALTVSQYCPQVLLVLKDQATESRGYDVASGAILSKLQQL